MESNAQRILATFTESEKISVEQPKDLLGLPVGVLFFSLSGLLAAALGRWIFSLNTTEAVVVFAGTQITTALVFIGVGTGHYLSAIQSRLRVLALDATLHAQEAPTSNK